MGTLNGEVYVYGLLASLKWQRLISNVSPVQPWFNQQTSPNGKHYHNFDHEQLACTLNMTKNLAKHKPILQCVSRQRHVMNIFTDWLCDVFIEFILFSKL